MSPTVISFGGPPATSSSPTANIAGLRRRRSNAHARYRLHWVLNCKELLMRYARASAWVLTLLGSAGVAAAAEGPSVTFTKDVAPIVYKSCVECHRPTMFAPMSLVTYDDARPY